MTREYRFKEECLIESLERVDEIVDSMVAIANDLDVPIPEYELGLDINTDDVSLKISLNEYEWKSLK